MLSKQLQKMLDGAVEVKAKILKELKPLRLKEDKLQKDLDEIAAELRTVREKIVAIEQPELAEATLTINALSRKGNKGIKAESGNFGIDGKSLR
ncbi:hypothetical protein KAR91_33525 [Candidatus Pacearchaeota archaeon]|nr:hypothetical protein [Candidatus Pacearchaeota archaeon]